MTAVALAALYIAYRHFVPDVALPEGFWVVVVIWALLESSKPRAQTK